MTLFSEMYTPTCTCMHMHVCMCWCTECIPNVTLQFHFCCLWREEGRAPVRFQLSLTMYCFLSRERDFLKAKCHCTQRESCPRYIVKSKGNWGEVGIMKNGLCDQMRCVCMFVCACARVPCRGSKTECPQIVNRVIVEAGTHFPTG